MTGLTHAQIYTIWTLTAETPLSVKKIANSLGLIGKKGYLKVYNFLLTKVAQQHFFIKKEDCILWVRANPLSSPQSDCQLDLNINLQNPNTTKIKSERHHQIPGIKRAGPERLEAILKTTRCKGYGYTDKKTGEFIKTSNIREEDILLFEQYIDRTSREKIVYTRSVDGDPVFSSPDVYLPYITRFTSRQRQIEIMTGYKGTWANASKRYLKGILLTLTADPKKYESLWHCNYAVRKAWDNLRSLFYSWFHKEVSWICAREFQKNGRLHFHVVLFGRNWLTTKSRIQFFWTRYGGGYIMDLHSIRQTPSGWVWSRGRPLKAAGMGPQSFLANYLKKSMWDSGVDYWVTGAQYWTASRNIRVISKKKEKSGNWFMKGIVSDTGFRSCHRSDSRAFFSGALLNNKQVG